MYTGIVPYKQSNPNRCLTVDSVMSLLASARSKSQQIILSEAQGNVWPAWAQDYVTAG